MRRAVELFVFFILFADVTIGQIHIRESVDIDPGLKSTSGIYDDPTRPVYLGVGGTITVKLERTYNLGAGLRKAVEETTGKTLVDVSNPEESTDSLLFENMAQWSKLVFRVDIGLPGGSVAHLYAGYGGSDVISDPYTHYLYFRVNPSTPIQYADVVLSLRLEPNSSLDAIPPSEVYDDIYFVNPFAARDLILPTGGKAFLTIDESNPTNQGDDLYMELPGQTLLVSNAPARVGDTIALGPVRCGEPLRLYLRSGKAVVAGMNLYPEISQKGDTPFYLTDGERSTIPVFLGDGRQAQIVGTMWFDDWTDLIYDKLTCTVYVISDTSNVFVRIDPPEVAPGDTATIIVRKHEDCGLTDYSPWQMFNVGISSDSCIGTILSTFWEDTSRYFVNTREGFQFIAPDSIEGDSVQVEITIGLPDEGGMIGSVVPGPPGRVNLRATTKTASSQQAGKKAVSSENDFTSSEYGVVVATIKKHTILLGETRYYYAVDDPNHTDRLIIRDSPKPMNGRTDVTFDDPEEVEGNKVGVYWEYMDAAGNDLKKTEPGSIRLVGRYWEEGKPYKVRLIANAPGRAGRIDIEVKKPHVLGDPNLSDFARQSVVTDVFGSSLNLDELIIKYAGENGIPPQFIKGQMEQECMNAKTKVFEPVWRYEPMLDITYQEGIYAERFFPDGAPFVKSTDHPRGEGDWPYDVKPAHSNVFSEEYSGSLISIGGYIAGNWDKYKRKGKLGEPDLILSSPDLSQRFKELYKPPKTLNKNTDMVAKQLAYNELGTELVSAKTDLAKRYDVKAQTRIVTSYGFTQLMYSMTVDYGGTFNAETETRYGQTGTPYMQRMNTHQFPEKLNEQNTFMPIYSDLSLSHLHRLFDSMIPSSQWQGVKVVKNKKGKTLKTIDFKNFETAWEGSLFFFNSGGGYGDLVMQKASNYLPH